ncbi:MAG TPA: sigma-70 family RNA polymerase sigma factor [Gemmataceae bacterium]|nr:sigma-70 family RNA polymerase sigma factor [Gemmataceae bacterium]
MPTTALNKVLEHLRRSLPPPVPADLSDGHLLERFLASRDQTAFAALVQRHGQLVMGVCNRVLGNVHDSEDAFQAVFFILARKAKSVLKREALGGWLYTVAFRTALEARAGNLRRRKMELPMPDLPEPEYKPAAGRRDWQGLLDQELNLLPQKYRTLVILCDLEGKTRKEVARQLKLNEGTLSSRLARARRMLATRLSRYGFALSGGALAASLAEGSASAKVSVSLVWTTAKAATLVAAGQYVGVSISAVGLMKGAMKTMFLAKLKTVIGTGIVAVMLGVGGLIYNAELVPGGAQAADGANPKSELEKLRKENELLKMNLQVTLEKIIAQEEELKRLRGQSEKARVNLRDNVHFENKLFDSIDVVPVLQERIHLNTSIVPMDFTPVWDQKDKSAEVEAAIKAWQGAKDQASRDKALEQLEKLIGKIRAGKEKEKAQPSGKGKEGS